MDEREKIKKWLRESGLRREDLGKRLCVSKRTVDNWLTGTQPIPAAKLEVIRDLMGQAVDKLIVVPLPDDFRQWLEAEAQRLHMAVDKLVADIIEKTALRAPEREDGGAVYMAECVGNVAAGGLMEGDTVPQRVSICRPLKAGEYVLRVSGPSMEPDIPDGALIIVRAVSPDTQLFLLAGRVVVYDDGRGVTLKELVETEDGYALRSFNPEFPDFSPLEDGRVSAVFVERVGGRG